MTVYDLYENKKISTEELAGQIKSGWVCGMDIAGGIPKSLSDQLAATAQRNKLKNIRFHMLLDIYPLDMLRAESSSFEIVSWFSGSQLRKAANDGRAQIMPCYYRDVPGLMDRYVDFDAVYLHVSPMDRHGYFSMPLSGSASRVLLDKAKRIYLQVNKNLPRSIYSPLIHISQITNLCEEDDALPIMPPTKIDDISKIIGDSIADEIPNGATIQLGIGAVPESVGFALKSKRNLGIHTELFTDSMVELIECGAVTNELKPIHKGKTVATLAFGSQRMYDFIDDNRAFELLPVDQVNDPEIIALHDNFISVNAALEVDFFGQVCAESIGTKHVSGSGGQVDYVRGAIQSKGGKSFIAFPSTAMNGKVSRIKPVLTTGAIVTTSKNDVDYIVTEYGMAKLRGKTVSQRTKELISIAHPDFRDDLLFEAKKMNILV